MKKLFKPIFLFMSVCGIVACSESALDEPQTPEATSMLDPKIKRVLALANAEMDRLCPPVSRADIRVPDMNALHSIAEATSRGEEDTLIYVVNYAGNEGFALVSARDSEDPVLAVVPSGNYNPETGSDNPGFNMFVEAAKEHVRAAPAIEITPDPGEPIYIIIDGKYYKEVKTEITHWGSDTFMRLSGNHLWGQGGLYARYCVNQLTGSLPLAMASTLTFLRFKESLIDYICYSYPGHDINGETIDWTQLYKHKNERSWNGTEWGEGICWETDKDAVHKTIARLCRQLGHEINASYSTRTTASMTNAIPVLKKYMPGYHVTDVLDFTTDGTMRHIDFGLVVVTGKQTTDSSIEHTFIADGYNYYKYEIKAYTAEIPVLHTTPLEWKYQKTFYEVSSKSHIVWGWEGVDDGWYSNDVFHARNRGESYTTFKYVSVTKGLYNNLQLHF